MNESKAKAWVTLIAGIAAAIVVVVGALSAAGVLDDDQDAPAAPILAQAPVPAAVAVDGPDANAEPDRAIELDAEARDVVKTIVEDPERYDFGPGLRGTDETGPVAQHEGPLASPSFPGCTTRILPTNWSDRTVSMDQVDGIGLHYTAGLNRPGLSDMDGLTAFASSPSAGVSWHFLIDAEGHCYYSVPLGKKAWTIVAANSRTINIEVVQRGDESTYPAGSAGAAKLRQVVRELSQRLDIPLRVGNLANCVPSPAGIVTHWQGGTCAGGHVDIKPYSLEQVVAAIKADPCGDRCKARRRQRRVLEARKRRHAQTHVDYQRERCRGRLHEVKAAQLRRQECRAIKERGHRQHAGIKRARRTLRAI